MENFKGAERGWLDIMNSIKVPTVSVPTTDIPSILQYVLEHLDVEADDVLASFQTSVFSDERQTRGSRATNKSTIIANEDILRVQSFLLS